MNFQSTREGIEIAVDALRADKVRAFLTILGISIGVATVTGMGAIMTGVERGINGDLEAIGPENFIVSRFDQTQIRISGPGNEPWKGKPPLTITEGRVLEELPSVRTVTPSVGGNTQMKAGRKELGGVQVIAYGSDWPSYTLGDFVEGRNYFPGDMERSAPVVVLSEELARQAFGETSAVGRRIRIGAGMFQVVGVYRPKPNLFQGGKAIWAVVPTTAGLKYLKLDSDWMDLLVVPAPGFTQTEAMDDVTMTLRTLRRLKPGAENNFALIRQEAFADLIGSITGAIKLVMMVLSSIGLMVGGVGVVGIMMISVTERTREIGVRKALGARRGEILWQFLVEAVTVTVIGGFVGLLMGAGGAMLLRMLTPVPAVVPLTSVAASIGIAAFTGILFGLYPAAKAARLDPVVALRYE
jgi:putative ABC transport system permease protein